MDEPEKPLSPEELTKALDRAVRGQRWHAYFLFALFPLILLCTLKMLLDLVLGT